MAAVWYLGKARVQRITPADWAAAGTTGPTVTWRPENGWSVPRASLTSAQLAVLTADGRYNTNAPDGPRPDSAIPTPSADALVSEAELDQLMADRTASSTSMVRQLLTTLGLGSVPDKSVTPAKLADNIGTSAVLRAASVSANAVALAGSPDLLIAGAITRDANGAATAAPVIWPDGDPGQYTATTVSTAFPGAVDAYTITKGNPVTKTYTQAAVTRDANGAVTQRPAVAVS